MSMTWTLEDSLRLRNLSASILLLPDLSNASKWSLRNGFRSSSPSLCASFGTSLYDCLGNRNEDLCRRCGASARQTLSPSKAYKEFSLKCPLEAAIGGAEYPGAPIPTAPLTLRLGIAFAPSTISKTTTKSPGSNTQTTSSHVITITSPS